MYTGIDGEENQGLCVGTENYLCINSKASEQEQKNAQEFLYWLYSSDTGKEFVINKLNFITPFDTFEEGEVPADPLAKEISAWLTKGEANVIPWNFTIFPSLNFKNDFGAALLQYAQGSIDWDKVKEIAITRWKEESKS